jgi:hypothetical protein
MAYCEHCGYRIPRGEEACEQCGDLDFTHVDDEEFPIDPADIKWADTGEYVVSTTSSWSDAEYIAIPDPEDVDNVFAHEPDREDPRGFLGILPLFRRRREK